MSNYKVEVEGHDAILSLGIPSGEGVFSGTIQSHEYGSGSVSGMWIGDHLTGKMSLDGHNATFGATISGANIVGTIRVGIFWSKNFTGSAIPA